MKNLSLVIAFLFSIQSFSQVKPKPQLTPLEQACNNLQGLIIDAMETCKNQSRYKKFVADLEDLECKKFSHSFFVVLRTLLENEPYRKDPTCFDKETFDSGLSESLINEIELKHSQELALLASSTKLSREAFMKLPLHFFSDKVLLAVGKRLPKESEERKKVLTLAFHKIEAKGHTKKLSSDSEKNISFILKEVDLARRKWVPIANFGASGCKAIEKVYITAPETVAAEINKNSIAKTFIELLALQPTKGSTEPPYPQPTVEQKKLFVNSFNDETVDAWFKKEELDADKAAFLKSIEGNNIRWTLLKSFLEKSLQNFEYQIDFSTVSRCSMM